MRLTRDADPFLHPTDSRRTQPGSRASKHSTAYTTFVTSHTAVISKDTKPTRFPYQFSRMQPKWSCKQALSPTGEKAENTDRRMERESERERRQRGREEEEPSGRGGFFLASTSFHLYNILKQGDFNKKKK
ncbi:hypothetical protein NQD34_000100 [Periophthalmus magnuspinnatus]|nr:hypothetical protein NQD34_000100 [Periophthalmus magnuspinnatus]